MYDYPLMPLREMPLTKMTVRNVMPDWGEYYTKLIWRVRG